MDANGRISSTFFQEIYYPALPPTVITAVFQIFQAHPASSVGFLILRLKNSTIRISSDSFTDTFELIW